jgi:predicted NUDIX family phosphoesterase
MRSILVVDRRHLFPGLSPQGLLPPEAVDLPALAPHLFFAERDYMEHCAHYKQLIPYLVLTRGRGDGRRVLAYQRRQKHTEQRLGGLWSVGFGGHIEPLDRDDREVAVHGLLEVAARRELAEETGLPATGTPLLPRGYINSDAEDVSSVHFGVVYEVVLDDLSASDADLLAQIAAQAEPHRARWLPVAALAATVDTAGAPDGGAFEDWSRIVITGGALGTG